MFGLGALGGAVTALITEGVKAFNKNQENKHEIKLLELQRELSKEETERESFVAAVSQYSDSIVSSRQHDTASGEGVSLWVKNLRASFRPLSGWAAYIFVFVLAVVFQDVKAMATIYIIAEAVTSFYYVNRTIEKRK